MNFQSLQKVETSDFYLGLAFRSAKDKADVHRLKRAKSKQDKSRKLELEKLNTVGKVLHNSLEGILKSFPSIDSLPPFYRDLVIVSLDYAELKQSLGALNWAMKQIDKIRGMHYTNLRRQKNIEDMNNIRRSFYGRVSSVMRQIRKPLLYLEQCRRTMKGFPTIKTSLFTVAIAGYPNVGKSSLLKALTSAKPEVDVYPFTTKTINIGYLAKEPVKVQLVDVPGTFDRSFDEMNRIEKQSFLVLRHVAHAVIFVFDTSESSAYSLDKQNKLLENVKGFGRQVMVVQNKSDLRSKAIEGAILISASTGAGIKEVEGRILGLAKEHEAKGKD